MSNKKNWSCQLTKNDKASIRVVGIFTDKPLIAVDVSEKDGDWATTYHTAAQAREMAAELIRLADEIENKAVQS